MEVPEPHHGGEKTLLVENHSGTTPGEQDGSKNDGMPSGGPQPSGHQDPQTDHNAAVNAKAKENKGGYSIAADEVWAPHRKHATKFDVVLLLCGTLLSAGVGALLPVFFLVFGDLIEQMNTTLDTDYYVRFMAWLGLAAFVSGSVSTACFEVAADRQVKAFKEQYFQSVVRQDMAWYDQSNVGSLASRLLSNIASIRSGIGLKLCMLIQLFVVIIGALVVGFIKSWKLTLVSAAAVPVVGGFGALVAWAIHKQEIDPTDAAKCCACASVCALIESYASAGAVSEEAFMAMRTVVSMGLEEHMTEKYRRNLKHAEKAALRASVWVSLGLAGLMASMFFMSALGLWYGGHLLADSTEEALQGMNTPVDPADPNTWPKPAFSGGSAITVFLVILIGAFSLGQVIPNCTALIKACTAAADLEELIGRTSHIDPLAGGGRTDVQLDGDIEFKNVAFSYPTRPERPIFTNLNLRIPAGKSVALVGGSGCGKSTVLQLLQRMYDCDKGTITVGGVPVKDINVATLRSHMGVVSQEPCLFSTTVRKNIEMGSPQPVSLEEVVDAAKQANADGFITRFPEGYETDCGAYGGQLSGGQKQRIAIARALIRRPSILIFDEATSALDTQSEKIVQEALDNLVATSKATTLIVAHRLSTIQNADLIVVLEPSANGATVVQQGTHHQLMKDPEGLYYHLVSSQVVPRVDELEEEEETVEETPPVHGDTLLEGAQSMRHVGSRVAKWALVLVGLGLAQGLTDSVKMYGIDYCGYKVATILRDRAFVQTVHQNIAFFDAPENNAGKLCSILSADVLDVKTGCTGNVVSMVQVFAALTTGLVIAFCGDWRLALVILAFCVLLIPANIIEAKMSSPAATHTVRPGVENQGSPAIMNQATSGIRVVCAFGLEEVEYGQAACVPLSLRQETQRFVADGGASPSAEKKLGGCLHVVASAMLCGAVDCLAPEVHQELLCEHPVGACNKDQRRHRSGACLRLQSSAARGTHVREQAEHGAGQNRTLQKRQTSTVGGLLRAQAILSLTFAVSSVGQTVLFTTDSSKAAAAGHRVFGLIDRVSEIDVRDSGGKLLTHESFTGAVELDRINFTYPTRPENRVYRNLSFSIKAGESVALVGASGCGKSTIVQLVERFYDLRSSHHVHAVPHAMTKASLTGGGRQRSAGGHEGRILLDNDDIRDLNVVSVRQQEGLVSQEPVLFDMTVEENIAISKPGATMAEVQEAAEIANAAGFISSFPNGYQTNVGRGGAQLSGGQKQRIAIARALIRKPRLLILDEATSALDAESERIVQKTIDDLLAKEKRSTIIVAHRLSTVRNADKIVVLTNEDRTGSRVAEVGTHDELIQKKGGLYRTLVGLAAIQSE
ncbi:ABC transporter B family member 21 [Cyclospora cayetanensis]|uniref:ABC transporter B family member 21 n=1 Tax=Cyclospora cayetanensis TaxID=88456 RepID=A0A6P6S4R5_9EIME|nr:ABC transporter B family member 21 [Cyclospora cayetanensis]